MEEGAVGVDESSEGGEEGEEGGKDEVEDFIRRSLVTESGVEDGEANGRGKVDICL